MESVYVKSFSWEIQRGMLNAYQWRACAEVELSDGTVRQLETAVRYTRLGAKRVALRWLRRTLGPFGERV